jgi:hypothetical protein
MGCSGRRGWRGRRGIRRGFWGAGRGLLRLGWGSWRGRDSGWERLRGWLVGFMGFLRERIGKSMMWGWEGVILWVGVGAGIGRGKRLFGTWND